MVKFFLLFSLFRINIFKNNKGGFSQKQKTKIKTFCFQNKQFLKWQQLMSIDVDNSI